VKLDIIKFDIHDIKIIRWITSALLLIFLVTDLFLFFSIFQEIKEAKAGRDKNVAMVNFFQGVISQKDKLARAVIIPQGNVDALLDKIQKIAKEDKLEISLGSSLMPGKQEDNKSFYTRKVFLMGVVGSFKNLGTFLTTLRGMPEAVLDLESLELSNDRNNAANLHADVRVSVLTTRDDENQ